MSCSPSSGSRATPRGPATAAPFAAFLYTAAALFAVLFGVSVAGAAARAELDRPRFWERVLVVGTGLTAGVWLLAGWVLFALALLFRAAEPSRAVAQQPV